MCKNRITAMMTAGMVAAAMILSSCGGSLGDPSGASGAATEAQGETESGEGTASVGNPWEDNVSEQEVYVLTGAYFIVPPDATDVVYRVNASQELAEMDFKLDGMDFTARMKPTEEFEDISGMYYEWEVDDEQMVGPSEGRARGGSADGEMIHSLLWRDDVTGIMYSLSVAAEDLDGFDIVGVAESMYQPETEEFMPGSFVEEAAGKGQFESFDEVISYLEKDNAYTTFKLEGFDGEILAVAENTFDDLEGHRAALEAAFYGKVNGTVHFIGNAFSGGTAYPLRCDGTVIYSAGNHQYESEFMDANGVVLIVKDYISQSFDDDGNVSYSGFMRETNTSEDQDIPEDPEEAEKLFDSFFDKLDEKPVMNFTVVE